MTKGKSHSVIRPNITNKSDQTISNFINGQSKQLIDETNEWFIND